MTLLVGWVVVFTSKDFHGIVYADNTHLSAVNIENSSTRIEYTYSLNYIPDGFELVETVTSPTSVYMLYENNLTKQTITLSQWVKSHYRPHINTEHYDIEETDINGYSGLCIDFSNDEWQHSVIIWDNGDYVIEMG